jgi:hypothetical protein
VTTWEQIDEPVLRWVASLPPSHQSGKIWEFWSRNPDEDAGSISGNSDPGMKLWWRLQILEPTIARANVDIAVVIAANKNPA